MGLDDVNNSGFRRQFEKKEDLVYRRNQIQKKMVKNQATIDITEKFGDLKKHINNAEHTITNDTAAAQLANSLVDGKDKDGNPTISADKFNAACAEHFPNVKIGTVTNYITVFNATGSFTDYAVRQQIYEKAHQRQEMETQGENPPTLGI